MLAAVIPFPREEVTPPVTKTYFATDQDLRGFFECYRKPTEEATRLGRSGSGPGALAFDLELVEGPGMGVDPGELG